MGGRHHPRASCSDACTSPHDCHRSRLPPRSIGSSRSSVACWPCGCTRAEAREAVRGAAPEQSSGTRSLWRRNFVTPTCTGGRCLAWGMRCNGSRSQPGREACCSRRGARSRAPASRGGGRRSSRLEAQTVEAAAVELRAASVVAGSVETRAGAAEATGSVEAAAGSRAGAQAAVMAAGICGAIPGRSCNRCAGRLGPSRMHRIPRPPAESSACSPIASSPSRAPLAPWCFAATSSRSAVVEMEAAVVEEAWEASSGCRVATCGTSDRVLATRTRGTRGHRDAHRSDRSSRRRPRP